MPAPQVHVDVLPDQQMNAALDACHQAEKRLAALTEVVAAGATSHSFPGGNPKAAIFEAVGNVGSRRYELNRLIASRAAGEDFRLDPAYSEISRLLLSRVRENDAQSPVLSLVAKRHADADREAGFSSFVMG